MPAGYLEGGLSTFTAFLVARLPEPQRGMCHVFKMISNNTISFYLQCIHSADVADSLWSASPCVTGEDLKNKYFQKTQNKTRIQWKQTASCLHCVFLYIARALPSFELANISIWKKVIVWKNILGSIRLGQLSVYWTPVHVERACGSTKRSSPSVTFCMCQGLQKHLQSVLVHF